MNGFIVLESGECFQGLWLGGEVERAGEVVFNTSHSGYEEIATDPSYQSQIVVMTAPMQGNYGISREAWESDRIWIEGFAALQIQNSERDHAWLDLLKKHRVPALAELDTRKLVLKLRDLGTPWGAMVKAETQSEALKRAKPLIEAAQKVDDDWVWKASCREAYSLKSELGHGPRVALLDFGAKKNILRETLAFASEVRVFPSRASAEEIMAYKPAALILSNGPGDPEKVQKASETIRSLLGHLPIFGICMGHQVLSLALGGKTYKLKFGHRGSNHPIRDELLKRVYMTSQNHGYAVDQDSIQSKVEVSQVNLNDNSVAGIHSEKMKIMSVQYHPESRPGPHDSSELFQYFFKKMIPTARGSL